MSRQSIQTDQNYDSDRPQWVGSGLRPPIDFKTGNLFAKWTGRFQPTRRITQAYEGQAVNALTTLRLKTYVFWPVIVLVLMNACWAFEKRVPAISCLLFAVLIWVLFFRAYRSQFQLANYRCPHCSAFFFRKPGWVLHPINVWRSRCIHCQKKPSDQ
jgi:hypothetical protein